MKFIYPVLGLGGIVLLASTASCGLLGSSQAPPSQPIVISNNLPSGSDSGVTILLTVAGIAAFLLLAVAIVMGMMWHTEKRRRTAAEDAVAVLMGSPSRAQIALATAAPISTDRVYAMAAQLPVQNSRKELIR